MHGIILVLIAFVMLSPAVAAADVVTPTERVRSRVIVRANPDQRSHEVGSLRPGEQAAYLGAVRGWRRVRLADGSNGFVSSPWTRVLPEARGAEGRAAPRSSVSRLLKSAARLFSSSSPGVDFIIRDPDPRQSVYRNTDPDLPVSGFARVQGTGRFHDVVLALDVSTSTNEFAGVDVDGDGKADDAWKGRDSIFAAQIAAARNLLRALEELPFNRDGARVRVGIVTYSGDERLHLSPEDKERKITPDEILRLAARDADVQLPLTSNYRAARRKLKALSRTTPVGSTDIAAGIGRAIIELAGMAGSGARSRPREDAQKVILFLTDGKPRLPYDRLKAEKAAVFAGKMAAEAGIRINAFALGTNAVTRSTNDSVKRMARRSGGSFVALENPGEIVAVLRSTPFSIVERVRIANQTTGEETRYIATGIDGSFYGEISLQEGENEIEIAALLTGNREASETFTIEYVRGLPARELAKQLKRIRIENEALIDRIRANLAKEMKRTRKEQRRALEVKPDRAAGRWPADAR